MIEQKEVLSKNSTGRHQCYHSEDIHFMDFYRIEKGEEFLDLYPLGVWSDDPERILFSKGENADTGMNLAIDRSKVFNLYPTLKSVTLVLNFTNVVGNNYIRYW